MKQFVADRNRFLAEFVRGKAVLDVGCVDHSVDSRDRGHWLHDLIRKSAKRAVGLDFEAAEVKRLLDEGYDVICADATAFELADKFDVVLAGEVMEHLGCPSGFLDCTRKHLLPGGELVTSTPNALCINYFVQNLLRGREIDNPDHVGLYSPTTMTALLRRHSFEPQRVLFYPELRSEWSGGGRPATLILVATGYAIDRGACVPVPLPPFHNDLANRLSRE